eukprot:CFRG4587T1
MATASMDPVFGASEMQPLSWVVEAAIFTCFALAMAMGANDVANAFGTSVGSGVITIQKAVIIAAVFNFVGAVTLGRGVADTIRKGIVDVDMFATMPGHLMLGNWSAVVGACAWVAFSTVLGLPTSTTNAVVGGVLGFAICEFGWDGVDTPGVVKIVASWAISPILAGCVAAMVYVLTERLVLNEPLERALKNARWFVSAICSFVIFMVVIFVTYDQTERGTFWDWAATVLALSIALSVFALLMTPFGIDLMFKRIKVNDKNPWGKTVAIQSEAAIGALVMELDAEKVKSSQPVDGTVAEANVEVGEFVSGNVYDKNIEDRFALVQILNAAYLSFNHGANDIANVAGPMAGVWGIYQTASVTGKYETPIWVLATMGLGISVGLFFFGVPIMKTIGQNMTSITPSRGFAMELGTATSVLIASYLKIPVSTTHAAVGAVVAVGLVSGKSLKQSVNWKLFSGIAIGWIITVPVSGLVSAGVYALFRPVVAGVLL